MKKRVTYLTTGLFLASAGLASAQSFTGEKAREIIPEADMVYKAERTNIPAFVELNDQARAAQSFAEPAEAIRQILNLDKSIELKNSEVLNTVQGIIQYSYQQHYKGIPVEGALYRARKKDGVLLSINGELYDIKGASTTAGLSENQALNKALSYFGAQKYLWENPEVEASLKHAFEDENATYYPKGELVFYPKNGEYTKNSEFKLSYKFKIHSEEPLEAYTMYIDASTGELLGKYSLIQTSEDGKDKHHHASPSAPEVEVQAQSAYIGVTNITVTQNGGQSCLDENQARRCVTYDNNNRQQPSGRTQICGSGDPLDLGGQTRAAVDAHKASEALWDHLRDEHGRNSIDNGGMKLTAYVNANVPNNAFWNGSVMTYGYERNSGKWLTALDIGGHEVTHGLVQHTAGLVYRNEPGALNESFADIFGNITEKWALGDDWQQAGWQLGDLVGWVIRSMSDPNAHRQPDTYRGTHWHTASSDNGGVHVNSGVQNYMFYLLVEGGNGSNDNNQQFDVKGIDWVDAAQVCYGALTRLTSNSQYRDAREAWVNAAKEKFGECSQQHISTQMAWYAVGIGQEPDCKLPPPVASFSADKQMICAGQTIQFTDESTGDPTSWNWTFDGGTPNTSMEQNPQVTYTRPGDYKVTLTVTNDGGSDDHTEEAFITVSEPAEIPLKEGFEDNFPIEGWTIENPDSATTWEKSTEVGAGSDACVIIDNANYDKVGQKDGLILKEVDLSSGSKDPNLTFFVAYTRYDEDSEDKLSVLISTDCGETWESIYSKTKEELETKDVDFDESQEWVPEEYADWRFEALNLSDYKDEKSVKIKFESTNGYGNIIWLDNINIDYTVGTNDNTVAEHDVVVAPNPTSNSFELRFTAKEKDNYSIEVRNVLGEIVYVENLNNFSGLYNKSIDLASFSNGIYLLNIKDSNTNTVKKIIKK